MNRSLAPAAVLCLASLLPCPILPQQTASTPPPLPKNPVALLQLAWQQNGLHGADLHPWHVRGTWTEVDGKGKPMDTGTWEEWWAAENKYKISYTTSTFEQTLFVTDQGAFVTGNPEAPDWNFALAHGMVIAPLSKSETDPALKWSVAHERHGEVELTCVKNHFAADDCFADNLPVVRISTNSTAASSADSLIRFQGRYLARKMKILRIGLPETDLSLDVVESIPTVVDADFVPPPAAVPARSMLVSESVIAGTRIAGKPPEYPGLARIARASAVVWIDAVIRSDGSIGELHALTGPSIFQDSALKAVKTWRYKPYLIGGKPIDIRTRISVVYTITP